MDAIYYTLKKKMFKKLHFNFVFKPVDIVNGNLSLTIVRRKWKLLLNFSSH